MWEKTLPEQRVTHRVLSQQWPARCTFSDLLRGYTYQRCKQLNIKCNFPSDFNYSKMSLSLPLKEELRPQRRKLVVHALPFAQNWTFETRWRGLLSYWCLRFHPSSSLHDLPANCYVTGISPRQFWTDGKNWSQLSVRWNLLFDWPIVKYSQNS